MGQKIVVSGERTKTHCCENCGVQYAYRMQREAECPIVSFLGLSTEKARKKAEEEATKILENTFRLGADPVPCPHCGWYQREMVSDQKSLWFFVGMLPVFLAGVATMVAPGFMQYGARGISTAPWILGGLGLMAISFVVGRLLAKISNLNYRHSGSGGSRPDRAAHSRGRVVLAQENNADPPR